MIKTKNDIRRILVMKKFIGKSAAIAVAALLFAQSVPMAEVGAEGSNTLYIHSYQLTDGAYTTAESNVSSGTISDQETVDGIDSASKSINSDRTYKMYLATPKEGGGYTIASTSSYELTTDNDGIASKSAIENGIYWVDPVDDGVNAAFSNADGFFVQLPGASNDVHVYPKNTDNSGDKHKIVFTKTGEENATISGVKFKVYYKDAQDKWVAAEPSTDYATNSDGKIEISNLPLGDYYFVEQAAPDGYLLNQKPQKVTVDGTNNPLITFKNDAVLTAKTEIDNDGAGDTYNWTITADLPETPANIISYTITDSFTGLKDVEVKEIGGLNAADYVVNTEDGKITITLTDSGIGKIQNGNPSELVISITSTKADNLSNGSEITNSVDISYEYAYDYESGDGLPDIPDIPDPDGGTTPAYKSDEHTYKYPVDGENPDPSNDVTLTVKDITISNVDSGDKNTEISGAEYEIYKNDGTTLVMDNIKDNGDKLSIVTGGLAPGGYKLKQTKVGENYGLNTTLVSFYVGTDGLIYSDAECKNHFNDTNKTYVIIENTKSQFALPFTGTTASRVFTIVGICVMLAAGVFIFIILKKKDEEEEESKS